MTAEKYIHLKSSNKCVGNFFVKSIAPQYDENENLSYYIQFFAIGCKGKSFNDV
jgi:hypothetical protein